MTPNPPPPHELRRKTPAWYRRMPPEPRATDARYDTLTRVLSIRYSNGLMIAIDARKSPFLAAHPEADFSEPYVTPGGDALVFDGAGLSVSVAELLGQLIPEDAARRKISALVGRARAQRA